MSLTLKVEQRLSDVGLVDFYNGNPGRWRTLAKVTFGFVKSQFPAGAVIRPDDVARALLPLLEVNESLTACLQEKKLKQGYWVADFADLILDRTWKAISS